MKKMFVLVLVTMTLVALSGIASAEHGNIGSLSTTPIRTSEHGNIGSVGTMEHGSIGGIGVMSLPPIIR